MNYKKRIKIDPKIMLGTPVIAGTRIPVYVILNLIAQSYTKEKIIKEYPDLTPQDIQAAVEFGAKLARFEQVEVPA